LLKNNKRIKIILLSSESESATMRGTLSVGFIKMVAI